MSLRRLSVDQLLNNGFFAVILVLSGADSLDWINCTKNFYQNCRQVSSLLPFLFLSGIKTGIKIHVDRNSHLILASSYFLFLSRIKIHIYRNSHLILASG